MPFPGRLFWQTTLCLLLFGTLLVSSSLAVDETHAKPNIILVMADDLGIQGIGSYGSRVIPTPKY